MFIIRKIQSADLNKCAELLDKSYSKPPHNEKSSISGAFDYVKRKFDYCRENSFVVEEDKNVIGFIIITDHTQYYWTNHIA